VQNGCVAVPDPVSEQLWADRSTYRVETSPMAGAPATSAATRLAATANVAAGQGRVARLTRSRSERSAQKLNTVGTAYGHGIHPSMIREFAVPMGLPEFFDPRSPVSPFPGDFEANSS
jgi:hypothetical protein